VATLVVRIFAVRSRYLLPIYLLPIYAENTLLCESTSLDGILGREIRNERFDTHSR
jgi:hypothetical protein